MTDKALSSLTQSGTLLSDTGAFIYGVVSGNSRKIQIGPLVGGVGISDVTPFITTLLDDTGATTARATLGAQPLDADLTAIAALTTASFGRARLTDTGATTAFNAIKQNATESATGVLDLATDAEIRAATTGAHALTAADLESAAAAVALTDAATVAVDWDAGINFTLTVTASRVIGNPTNGQPGTFRTIMVQGNDTTDRTLTFGNQYLGEVPTITDCDSGRWYLLTIYCHTTTHFVVSAKRANG